MCTGVHNIYIYIYICVCVCIYIYIYICVCVYIYMCVYTPLTVLVNTKDIILLIFDILHLNPVILSVSFAISGFVIISKFCTDVWKDC